jgi:cytoskeletal protein CcmA (bactofilin family)
VLNFSRNDRMPEPNPKDAKPAVRPNPLAPAPSIPPAPPAAPAARTAAPAPAPAPEPAAAAPAPSQPRGSTLAIGVNINLKGVEISNCDVVVIEGNVDATINSKIMEIGEPGRLNGTAIIDVAEIHGDFSGELTARTKLVVHATGRVSGTVRYGKLVVAEGGMLTGELKQLDASGETKPSASTAASASGTSTSRPLLNPQPH